MDCSCALSARGDGFGEDGGSTLSDGSTFGERSTLSDESAFGDDDWRLR